MGVKLAIWLPTIKSRESTRPRCMEVEWDRPLESFRWELQLRFRPRSDLKPEQRAIVLQSCESPNLGSFRTPFWESRDKKPFGRGCCEEAHRILYGGRWWLPSSSGHDESCESRIAHGCPNTKSALESELTNLLVGLMQVRVSN
jgi:hypothetical protein